MLASRIAPRYLILIPAALSIAPRPSACLTIVYVDARATGPDHDGTSWCTAFLDLQEAIAAAKGSKVDAIHVASGTYRPAPPGGDRTIAFEPPMGVAMIGGFGGCTSEFPDSRSPTSSRLSGDLNGDDAPDFMNISDNSYSVLRIYEPCVLDGFGVTAGNGTGSYPYDSGGGAHILAPDMTIVRNCAFFRNKALYGGGARVRSSALLDSCSFSSNWADKPSQGYATFIGYGGGLSIGANNAEVRNCTFLGNKADRGGAVNIGGTPLFLRCTFTDNEAGSGGGARVGGDGNPTFIQCSFSGNHAFGTGGGVYLDSWSTPAWGTFRNCLVFNNTATHGAGIINTTASYGGSDVTNCTIVYNVASDDYGGIGMRYRISLTNSIVYFNRDASGQSRFAQVGSGGGTISFSCIQNWEGAGNGNINLNPMLRSTVGYRLGDNSPCRDAGDPATTVAPDERDINRDARLRCGRIDIGASEFWDFGLDFNCDGAVALDDSALFVDCLLGPNVPPTSPDCGFSDVSWDNDTDLEDLAWLFRSFYISP